MPQTRTLLSGGEGRLANTLYQITVVHSNKKYEHYPVGRVPVLCPDIFDRAQEDGLHQPRNISTWETEVGIL